MLKRLVIACSTIIGIVFGAAPATAQETLRVAVYGGEWGEAISKAILKPFEEKTGIHIAVETGNSAITLAKMQQQKGNPEIDAAWLDGGVSEVALQQGLLQMFDPAKIPDLANMVPEAVYKTGANQIYSLSTGFYAVGLVYNKDKVKVPPTSYLDLWKPEFANVNTMPSPANVMAFPYIIRLAEVKGGSLNDLSSAIRLLKEAKPAVFYDTSGTATNLFQSGEVIAGVHYASAAWYMSDHGLPMVYVVPKEGALAGDIRIHIVNGTKHLAAAQRLASYAVSGEAQAALSNILYLAPVAKGVELSPTAKARMPYGASGSMKNLYIPDWQLINQKRAEITELFNKQVLSK